MNELNVSVFPSHRHDTSPRTNDMVLVVEVLDRDGLPVTGLELENFEVWQLGMAGFGNINPILIQDLEIHGAALAGVYHVVPRWSLFIESQVVFSVTVTRDSEADPDIIDSGRGLGTLITQGDQD